VRRIAANDSCFGCDLLCSSGEFDCQRLGAGLSNIPQQNVEMVMFGGEVVNVVLSSATGAMLTGMLPASVTSSGAAMKTVVVSASALPA